MQAIGIPSGTLTKEETYELGKSLLKAGYAVKIGEKELKDHKKIKCVFYGASEEVEAIDND
jgi:hypothetical protein|nr:hypothetical protein [uncultured Lachnoclostridium sp.]